MRACVRGCVPMCVCACVCGWVGGRVGGWWVYGWARACVRVCVCVCVCVFFFFFLGGGGCFGLQASAGNVVPVAGLVFEVHLGKTSILGCSPLYLLGILVPLLYSLIRTVSISTRDSSAPIIFPNKDC